MSNLSAKALGFPTTIVHGMWSAARMLAAVENRVPPAYVYDIAFGKPVLLPSTVKFVAHDGPDGVWQLALRNAKKGTVLARASVGPTSVLQIPQRMRVRCPRAVEHREHVCTIDIGGRLEAPDRLVVLVDDQRAHAFHDVAIGKPLAVQVQLEGEAIGHGQLSALAQQLQGHAHGQR